MAKEIQSPSYILALEQLKDSRAQSSWVFRFLSSRKDKETAEGTKRADSKEVVIELGWVVVTVSSCIRKVGGKTGEVTLLDVIRKVGDRGQGALR